jgi:hypothetical protein
MSKITKAKADAQAKLAEFLRAEAQHHQNKLNRAFWMRECRLSDKALANARRDFRAVEKYLK